MANSSSKSDSAKRRKDFPLSIHKGTGRWFKKVRGQFHYFGKVTDDPEGKAALELWLEQRDDLFAGRRPRRKSDELSLKDLVNSFLMFKDELVESGEITKRTHGGYKEVGQLLVDIVGSKRTASDIGPDDFADLRAQLSKRFGPVSLTNRIQVIRSIFKYGYDAGLLERPARFGLFKKPRAKVIRETRIAKGEQDFTAAEVRALLDHATKNMRAMILLGIQAGFGNKDCADLTVSAINLQKGWIDYPREKVAAHRRVPLMPDTVAALRDVIESRKHHGDLVFVGSRGADYRVENGGYRVAQEFSRAAKAAGISGRGFYCCRRTFQTVAEESGDLVAVMAIMGHIPSENDMSARYRQRVSDERLRCVVNVVHDWVWPRPSVIGVAS